MTRSDARGRMRAVGWGAHRCLPRPLYVIISPHISGETA